jgi:hypothetical protein
MSDKIKVAGYSKKEVYNGNIIYTNFSPDLVGLQLASDGGTPLFTMGNFAVTTNLEPKVEKNFTSNYYSSFVSLEDLKITQSDLSSLFNNGTPLLNLNKSNLKYYARFGSLIEFVRVSLEDIIINWPASLYVTSLYFDNTGNALMLPTYSNYTYNSITNTSNFSVNTNLLTNNFSINYLSNGTIIDTFNETNDLRNLAVNYASYSILVDGNEYDVIGFTGSTTLEDDYMYLEVKGNVFSGISTTTSYHIKPNKTNVETFFAKLPDFESYLLNRMVTPIYTANFKYSIKSESGTIIYTEKDVTWPVSDGYNIEFDTFEYDTYAASLLDIAANSDLVDSNLMNRFLVSESITAFDTVPVFLAEEHLDTSGQKVNKTLNIYGAEFDSINNYIVGISFAHTVSYDKQDNTPDVYLKDLAKVLGWDLISSVVENDLLTNIIQTSESTYSGQSVGLTAIQADIELWRRLILNSPWIWKSKGARKAIEFLLKFIGSPDGLVTFNEHVYKIDAPIDVDMFTKILEANNLSTDLASYSIDKDGYPYFQPDTNDMYFQGNGKWYRETGGSGSTIDITTGNNPHAGLYDGGNKYLNQLRNLIQNFTPVVISSETITTNVSDLFLNYNKGDITNYNGSTYVDVKYENGASISRCLGSFVSIIDDPKPEPLQPGCGCGVNKNDDALSICISGKTPPTPPACPDVKTSTLSTTNEYYVFNKYQYDQNGNQLTNTYQTIFTSKSCCNSKSGSLTYTETYDTVSNEINAGYVCCKNTSSTKCGCSVACDWLLVDAITIPNFTGQYCEFKTLKGYGSNVVVTSDGSHCPSTWTNKIANITDPYTGLVGFGCQLTSQGIIEFDRIKNYFLIKSNGGEGGNTCCNYTYTVYNANNPSSTPISNLLGG